MTGVDLFGASRARYLGPIGGDQVFCVGNAAECDHCTEDGAVRIPWKGAPRPEDVARIRGLALCPTEAQLRKAVLPAYLPDLVNLRSLKLPAPLVAHLTSPTLTSLVIGNHDGRVPSAPLAADTAVPALRALMWVTSYTTPRLPQVVDPLPPLEFLRTNVSGDDAVLRQLGELPSLRHLELEDLKNADVVGHLVAPLRVLEIAGTGRDFPVARLAAIPTLEALRLNGIRAEIDCTVFQALPELVQLTVLNSKRIVNVEALLDCPKLASVTVVNCGNPFKKAGGELFRSKGFAGLDIDYS
ncbi:hypothetical protein [Lentzea sp. NEAU-D7]|uniref:hypothetical protein n=1 Tax=Lentzea sp. NEAU-D7 TaxID=2994667 RepID=UPI00224AB34F|nr:hypothetical protein [Lentzea sp. NEAU-D7]MCX2949116.1 hypothetical protein [Lentzea sp. NEAU-D7]